MQNSKMRAAAEEDLPGSKRGKKTPEVAIELPSTVFVEFASRQGGELMSAEDGKSTLHIPASSTVQQLEQLANSFLEVSYYYSLDTTLLTSS